MLSFSVCQVFSGAVMHFYFSPLTNCLSATLLQFVCNFMRRLGSASFLKADKTGQKHGSIHHVTVTAYSLKANI